MVFKEFEQGSFWIPYTRDVAFIYAHICKYTHTHKHAHTHIFVLHTPQLFARLEHGSLCNACVFECNLCAV